MTLYQKFVISPMSTPGRNVFPIARTFEDLLRLLLAIPMSHILLLCVCGIMMTASYLN